MTKTKPREFTGTRDGGQPITVRVWRDGSIGHTDWVDHAKLESDKGSAPACQAALEAFVAERLAEGFVEVGEPPVKKLVPALDPSELAKLVPEGPSAAEEAPYLVLADWLQAQGHPWGELIVLQQRRATATGRTKDELEQAIEAILVDHGTALVGNAIAHRGSQFEWHLGFVRGATLGFDPKQPLEPLLEDFLHRPITSQLRALKLSPVIEDMTTVNDWDSTEDNIVTPFADLEMIAKHVRVTKLGLGMSPPTAAAAYVRMPAFAAITTAFPNLTHLEVTGWVVEEPGTLALPALRELVVKSGEIDGTTLEAITSSDLPKLERLTVSFGGNSSCVLDELFESPFGGGGSEDYEDTFSASDLDSLDVNAMSSAISSDDLETFLEALPGGLRHLGLQSLVLDDEMIGVIAGWPGLAKLASLDLSGGTLANADVLAKAKKAFGHLTTLDLRRNLLAAAAAKKLKTALPNAQLDDQRKTSKDDVPAPELFTRFVATME